MKRRKILFVALSVVFITIVAVIAYDMVGRTTPRWVKKVGLNKYRNTIEVK